jgi:hypothetical protein
MIPEQVAAIDPDVVCYTEVVRSLVPAGQCIEADPDYGYSNEGCRGQGPHRPYCRLARTCHFDHPDRPTSRRRWNKTLRSRWRRCFPGTLPIEWSTSATPLWILKVSRLSQPGAETLNPAETAGTHSTPALTNRFIESGVALRFPPQSMMEKSQINRFSGCQKLRGHSYSRSA